MQLNVVDLPAPFGPIRACTVPGATAKLRSLTAKSPPKATVRFSTASSGSDTTKPSHALAEEGEYSLGGVHHEDDQDQAVDNFLI